MSRWFVEIEAFGHVRADYVEAASEAEALAKMHERIGYRVKRVSAASTTLDSPQDVRDRIATMADQATELREKLEAELKNDQEDHS